MKDAVTDPVCGMQVQDARISTMHEDIQYAFCSTQCQQKFIADPSAFLAPQAGSEKKGCCG